MNASVGSLLGRNLNLEEEKNRIRNKKKERELSFNENCERRKKRITAFSIEVQTPFSRKKMKKKWTLSNSLFDDSRDLIA